jgi:DNA ligase-1
LQVGTGFKDEDLINFTEKLRPLVIPSKRRPINFHVGDALEPDDWFESVIVWELQAADLSKSSVHKGGIGKIEAGKGIGLRFPRFIRERDDKKPENATRAEQIVEMYNSQGEVGAVNDNEDDDEELI